MVIKKRKTWRWIMVAVVIAIVSFFGYRMLNNNPSANYLSESVSKQTIINYYTFTGVVESRNVHNVKASNSMKITEVYVKEGSTVKVNQKLFKMLDGTYVKSKVNGKVIKMYVEDEQMVGTGTPMCDIYDLTNKQIVIKIDEHDLVSIKVGSPIEITVAAVDKTIEGTVRVIDDIGVNQNGIAYYTAKINIPTDVEIKVGMTAEGKIINQQADDVLAISVLALNVSADEDPFVYVLADDSNPKSALIKQYVTLGINDGKFIQIIEGLKQDQKIFYQKTTTTQSNFGPPRR